MICAISWIRLEKIQLNNLAIHIPEGLVVHKETLNIPLETQNNHPAIRHRLGEMQPPTHLVPVLQEGTSQQVHPALVPQAEMLQRARLVLVQQPMEH